MSDICDIPKNRPDYKDGFPGSTIIPACSNIASKVQQSGDQITMDLNFKGYIDSRGLPILYYSYLYEVDKTEKLWGEHSAAGYSIPFDLIAFLEFKDTPSFVTPFGFDNDDSVTAWLHIRTFREEIMNILNNENHKSHHDLIKIYKKDFLKDENYLYRIQPKVKDLIQLKTFGCDREFERGNRIFEITHKEDEILSENFNPAMGHYIWKLSMKRYVYSFEDGMSNKDEKSKDNQYLGELGEKGNHQVYDTEPLGKLINVNLTDEKGDLLIDEITGLQLSSENTLNGGILKKTKKKYKQDIEEDSKEIFDMNKNIPGFYKDDFKSNIKTNGYF